MQTKRLIFSFESLICHSPLLASLVSYKKRRRESHTVARSTIGGLRIAHHCRTSKLQKPHAEYDNHPDLYRNHNKDLVNIHIHKASTVCLIPDSDKEICEVSNRQEKAPINAFYYVYSPPALPLTRLLRYGLCCKFIIKNSFHQFPQKN